MGEEKVDEINDEDMHYDVEDEDSAKNKHMNL